jgi:hypothetical protein
LGGFGTSLFSRHDAISLHESVGILSDLRAGAGFSSLGSSPV